MNRLWALSLLLLAGCTKPLIAPSAVKPSPAIPSLACGPPNYACSTSSVAAVSPPKAPFDASSAVNSYAYDTSLNPFGKDCITRITNAATAGGHNFSPTVSQGDGDNMMSSDSAYLAYVDQFGGQTWIQQMNPNSDCYKATNPGSRLGPIGGSFSFSRNKPKTFYHLKANGEVWIGTISGATFADVKFFDFKTCPELQQPFVITGHSMLTVADGDTDFLTALSDSGGQGTGTYVVDYRPGAGCSTWNTETHMVDAFDGSIAPDNLGASFGIHNLEISHNGKFALVSCTKIANGSMCGAVPGNSTFVWEFDTNHVQYCSQSCGGHWSNGYNVHFNFSNPTAFTRPFSDVTQATNLFRMPHVLFDSHTSGNYYNQTDTAAYISASSAQPNTCAGVPFCNELYAYMPDGTMRRFNHLWTDTGAKDFPGANAIMVVDQLGSHACWASYMNGQLAGRTDIFCTHLQ